jgi:copper resistance protein B
MVGVTVWLASTSIGWAAADQPEAMDRSNWPSPVMDEESYGLFLLDLLEFSPRKKAEGSGDLGWDLLAWRGGDVNRLWIKTEGSQAATLRQGGGADLRVLYGKLITAFFDLQAGLRYERTWGDTSASRWQAVLGLQGLAPYSFDIEPEIYISNRGEISFRFTAEQDLLFTQRLILQPRIETGASFQKVDRFSEGAGWNDLNLGLRLRYEIHREIAPYLGVSWEKLFGQTAKMARAAGRDSTEISALIGIRAWY